MTYKKRARRDRVRVLATRVDWLGFGLRGRLNKAQWRLLEDIKGRAIDSRSPVAFEAGTRTGHMAPYSAKSKFDNFEFICEFDFGYVLIRSRERAVASGVPFNVRLKCEYLWTWDVQECVTDAIETVRDLMGEIKLESFLQRIDLACDLAYADFRPEDRELFWASAKAVTEHSGFKFQGYYPGQKPPKKKRGGGRGRMKTQRFWRENTFTGFLFGRRTSGYKRVCRIYNKSAEIEQASSKWWLYEIWKKAGYRESMGPVWRVEFELKGDYFKSNLAADMQTGETKSVSLDMVLESLPKVWAMQTKGYLRHCVKDTKRDKRRWDTSKLWQAVQNADFGEFSAYDFVPETKKQGSLERLYVYFARGSARKAAIIETARFDQAWFELGVDVAKFFKLRAARSWREYLSEEGLPDSIINGHEGRRMFGDFDELVISDSPEAIEEAEKRFWKRDLFESDEDAQRRAEASRERERRALMSEPNVFDILERGVDHAR